MAETKLAADEARRVAHNLAMQTQVERNVNANIAQRSEHTSTAEEREMDRVAGEFRGKAIDEVVGKGREARRARVLARVSQVVDYVFFVVYALLGIRLALGLIAARSGSGFVRAIEFVTDPVYAMFSGIVSSPSAGGYTLLLPVVVAIGFYALLHLGVTRLLRLIAHRRTEI